LETNSYREPFKSLIGDSKVMQEVRSNARKMARADIPLLLAGESGTGKRLLGRLIHESSPRNKGPFVVVDCAAIPKELLEDELFGHEKGAFTGAHTQQKGYVERADGGSLFLDRVAELTTSVQLRFARFLEERVIQRLGGRERITVDTRIFASIDEAPKQGIKDSRLQYDLYLHFVPIHLPPLREREEDVLSLAEVFLKKYVNEQRVSKHGFSRYAKEAMMEYSWAGNVRELETRVRRAASMAEESMITPVDLGLEMQGPGRLQKGTMSYQGQTLKEAREALEKELVSKALSRYGGNLTRAAEELGISRPTLYELMEKLNLPKKGWPQSPLEAKDESLYNGAKSIQEKPFDPEHLDVARSLIRTAKLYTMEGKYSEAEYLYRRSLAILEEAFGPGHGDVTTTHQELSELYKKMGGEKTAEELEKSAAALGQASLFTVEDKEN
jgi:two-component system, NtrC family, response regulator